MCATQVLEPMVQNCETQNHPEKKEPPVLSTYFRMTCTLPVKFVEEEE